MHKKLSWWPRPQAWAGSGLDMGFWSSQCEDWFQKRLENIHQGVSRCHDSSDNNRPVNNMHWKQGLKFNAATKKFKKNLDTACSNFLATKASGKSLFCCLLYTSDIFSAFTDD
jgi:hypothetical protein